MRFRGKGEETVKGIFGKYRALELIHSLVLPKRYLEIGVQRGRSLCVSKCSSVGVDPNPKIKAEVMRTWEYGKQYKLYTETSDEYFSRLEANDFIPDLVFIDGMHLIENVLRDFINVERIGHSKTVILIDDVSPVHPVQAERERRTSNWCGDVWKIIPILKEYRKDLILTCFEIFPTGLLMVQNINSMDSTLNDNYDDILKEYQRNIPVPDAVLNREGIDCLPKEAVRKALVK